MMAKVHALKKYEPYRPSNGTDGHCFMEAWCSNCARDLPMSEGKDFDSCGPGETCDIIARSMAYSPGDAEYPQEWVYGENGPMCSAFVRSGHLPPERCKYTIDMFDSNESHNGGAEK